MFKRLLVPLDGSAQAEGALIGAALLAKRSGAEVVLVRVTPPRATEFFAGPTYHTSSAHERAYVDQRADHLRQEGVPVQATLVLASPAEGIARQAALAPVDLIVMTTHGRAGLEALLHPSVTWQVLRETSAPILTWKSHDPAAEQPAPPRFMIDPAASILIPLDGSLQAERALPFAEALARTFGNPLVLVRAVEAGYSPGMEAHPQTVDEVLHWRLAEAQDYLQHQRLELMRAGFQVTSVAEPGPAAPLIEAWVQQYQVGLVVLASHGRGWLGQVVLGSIARRVLSRVEIPVLLIRRSAAQSDTVLVEERMAGTAGAKTSG